MSLSKRVNVFLERARNLHSTSPKLTQKSRSPVKQLETYSPKNSFTPSSKPCQENPLIADLEQMIDSFLRSRTDTLKRVENTSQKERKFIEEVKKTIESEKIKSKNSGISDMEKEYKEKAEKILAIVKQEASRIDRKLVELQAENLKLKQQLTEKNLEVVDKKLLREVYSVDQVLSNLSSDLKVNDQKEVTKKLLNIKGTVYDGSLDSEIFHLLSDTDNLSSILAFEILSKSSSWESRLNSLEQEIEKRRSKYQNLDHQIKNLLNPNTSEVPEFGSRQVRSATFGNTSESSIPSVSEILSKVFTELINEIEALEAEEALKAS
jgi:hypothetical protein